MSEEMEQALIWILGAVSLVAVLGWIFTYLRLRGTFFVVNEDSLKVTYYFLDERQYNLDEGDVLLRIEELLPLAEEVSYVYPITDKDILVSKEDTFQYYARKIHSMKPPPMRLIAIQIQLIKGPRK